MGRKLQGAKLRAKKRGKEAAKELVETKAQDTETQQVTEKADDQLFVIDTTAVLPSKKTLHKKKTKQKFSNSAKEKAQIEKLVAKHTKEQLERMTKTKTARHAMIKGAVNPKFDLWGTSTSTTTTSKDQQVAVASKKKKKTLAVDNPAIGSTLAGIKPSEHVEITTTRALPAPKAASAVRVDLAKSGQSYNPDKVLHKKTIMEAVQVERKRELAEAEKKAPISTGMSAETRKYIVGDTDSEDESDDDDDANENNHNNNDEEEEELKVEKKKEKLTRAQRNKQKRLRAEQREIEARKRQKKFEGTVGEAKTIAKKLRKEEAKIAERKLEIEKIKKEHEPIQGKDVYTKLADENPIAAPTYPVALPSELKKAGGGLRTIKPKGSLLTDRFASLRDRDMAPKKQLKKKKRVEGKRRKMKIKVKGKGFKEAREENILG